MKRSRGEIKIEEIFKHNNLVYATEYIFPDLVSSSGRPLRFDFAVFDDDGQVDFLIEYQGVQHYAAVKCFGGKKGLHQQKHNDNLKKRYCAKHGIPLVAIPYWDEHEVDYDYIINKVY